ncbi:MAG: proline iminopeptidase-family hydrolase, partial [Candidatus Binatia bacterium]
MRRFSSLLVEIAAILAATGCASTGRLPLVREGAVAVTGGNVWYKIVGADRPGVPLLVLHGGPGIPHDYMTPLEALADERPVVFYDQLGCGNSDRPADETLWTIERYVDELVRVREALHLDHVHILGHSWGSMLAVDYMLTRRPAGVVSLTLAGPPMSAERWFADQRVWLLELPRLTQEAIRDAEASGNFDSPEYQTAVAAFYNLHVCRLDPWPDFVQDALSPEKMGQDVYLYMWGPSEFTITGTLKDFERVDRLKEITTPTLLTCGHYDEATPAATEYYHRNMPGSEFAVIDNASH